MPKSSGPSSRREAVKALLKERRARFATIAFVDLAGQLRGKTVAAEKVLGAIEKGIPFSPYSYTMDLGDIPLPPHGYLDGNLAFEDNLCLVADGERSLPFEDKDSNLLFFVEFAPGTRGHEWDPRVAYRRAEARLHDLGARPVQALEYEFRIFRETPETAAAKGYHDLKLLSEVSTYGGIMRQGVHAAFFKELRDMCDAMQLPLASLHWEVAPSLGEVALSHRPGIDAADDAVLFKTHSKVLAERHDLLLTFMARPLADVDGQSGHVHLSLTTPRGRNLFYDAKAEHGMSGQMREFVGGLQAYLPELLLMLAPNVNSFKRLVPGHFAPVAANWGIDNRTCGIRVIPGDAGSQRIECRVAGSDTNPYLVLAAILGAGALGMERHLQPGPASTGNTHLDTRKIDGAHLFPEDFVQAIDQFEKSEVAEELFGADFVAMFAGTRRAQARQFARMITNHELQRFLELT
jgi:glutamine synthetase